MPYAYKYTEILGRCGGGVPRRPSFLPLYRLPYRVQYKVHRLLYCSLVGHDAVVIEVPDHGQEQYTLAGIDI